MEFLDDAEYSAPDIDAPPTDQELADRVYAGDQYAFADLWQRHEKAVALLARHKGSETQDVPDRTQEAALSLWLSLTRDQKNLPGNAVRNLASRIVANKTVDYWRYRSYRPEELVNDYAGLDKPAQDPTPEEIATEAVDRPAEVLLALAGPKYGPVVRLVKIDGLKVSEAAKELNIPEGTVKSHTKYGLGQMRQAFAEDQNRQAS